MQTIIYHGASSSFIIQGKACQNTIKKADFSNTYRSRGKNLSLRDGYSVRCVRN